LHLAARICPGSESLRPYLHKLRGVKINGNIFIGEEVYLDNEYPERIEINDNARIGLRSTIICHFKGPGKIIIEKDAWIGPCCTIVAAGGEVRTIGEGATISAGSFVNKDILPFRFSTGVPAKPFARTMVVCTHAEDIVTFKKGLRPLR
jgi:acetyltransferase-like isoleucine patch superfamily enzyme